MRRDTQALVLLLVGVALLKVSIAGTYVRYVPAGWWPLLIIAALALLAVAGQGLWQEHSAWVRPLLARWSPAPRPIPAAPISIAPISGAPISAAPISVAPMSGVPISAAPISGVPISGVPTSAVPVSAGPAVAAGPEQAVAGYALHEGHDTEEFELLPPGGVSALTAVTVAMPVVGPRTAGADPPAGPLRLWNGDSQAGPVVAARGEPPRPRPAMAQPAGPAMARAAGPALEPPSRGRGGWLLLVPVLALLLLAPPALGSFPASRNGTTVAAGSGFGALPEGDPVPIGLADYAARSVLDRGRSLADRRVLLTGFVTVGANGEPYLARMVVGCCAADGRPVKVGLTGDVPPDLEPDMWLEVEGTYIEYAVRDAVNGGLIPYLQVTDARSVAPPPNPYEPRP